MAEPQWAAGKAGEHCGCHHLIDACLAWELPASVSTGAVMITARIPHRCSSVPPTSHQGSHKPRRGDGPALGTPWALTPVLCHVQLRNQAKLSWGQTTS